MANLNPLISIILPVYNCEKFIKEAIESVLNQTHSNWELLIINDGSTDSTEELIQKYSNKRITYFKQTNKGVSSARNIGLKNMKGEYFCFLDSDDVLPQNSLLARLLVFKENPQVSFVDGAVQYVDKSLNPINKYYQPNFKGIPFNKLLQLNPSCLFGNTWMIKRDYTIVYQFDTNLTHAEDLFFYLTLSENKIYDYTNELILYYRQSNNSAMKDIQGLENGYIMLIKNIRNKLHIKRWKIIYLKLKISKIMILSFLFDAKKIGPALKSPFKVLTT